MGWINTPENIEDYVGFVYEIIEIDTRMVYYGCKKFWKTVKYKPLKGRKNKRHRKKETDWKNYKTSSPIMQKKIRDNPDNYHMRIMCLCESVSDMKAQEAYIQLRHYVNGRWHMLYNECINLRMRIPK